MAWWPTTGGTPRSTRRWSSSCATGTRRGSRRPWRAPTRTPGDRGTTGAAAPRAAGQGAAEVGRPAPPRRTAPGPVRGTRAASHCAFADRPRHLRLQLPRLEPARVVHELAGPVAPVRLRGAAQLRGTV